MAIVNKDKDNSLHNLNESFNFTKMDKGFFFNKQLRIEVLGKSVTTFVLECCGIKYLSIFVMWFLQDLGIPRFALSGLFKAVQVAKKMMGSKSRHKIERMISGQN